MSNNRWCKNCIFYGGQVTTHYGVCRRFPPQRDSSSPSGNKDSFPSVSPHDWCGEFKRHNR